MFVTYPPPPAARRARPAAALAQLPHPSPPHRRRRAGRSSPRRRRQRRPRAPRAGSGSGSRSGSGRRHHLADASGHLSQRLQLTRLHQVELRHKVVEVFVASIDVRLLVAETPTNTSAASLESAQSAARYTTSR